MNINTSSPSTPPVILELTRGGIIESQHRGYICVTDASGEILYSRGNPDFVTFLRSSAKPFQAAAVVTSGAADAFKLSERELALVAGSHGGEKIHTETVVALLTRAGISIEALQCGIHPPLDADAKADLDRHGEEYSLLHHNCSGKHTGMLLTAKHLGFPLDNYLDPTHPLQTRITAVIAECANIPVDQVVIGIDGCSAPVHGIPMRGIATMFARLVEPYGISKPLSVALKRVGAAMRAHPEMVAATKGRICTDLMRVGGSSLITAKAGAEGVYGAGWWDDGRKTAVGVGLKVEDGTQRGRDPALMAILQQFGALSNPLTESLAVYASGPIKNWRGIEVGWATGMV